VNRLLEAALGYAARGIPVYPVHWPHPTPGGASLACSCPHGLGCDRPAKHPLVRHGVKEATTDPDRLGRWWRRWPQANLGLATGVVFDALDIDGPAGLAALGELQQAVGLRLPGPLVATGGGGWHHWFRPTGLGNRPPCGLIHVDWRGRGGCVLAPPSRHICGRPCRWLRSPDQAPLAEVPAALRLLLNPDPPTPARPARTPRPDLAGHPYGRRVLAAELAALGEQPPASATAPSTAPPSRSTATSPAASSTTRTSPSPSPPSPERSGSVRPRPPAPWPRPAPPAWPTPAPSRPHPTPAARRSAHDRALDLPEQRGRRPRPGRRRLHPLL
jgi:hypothetical protein